MTEKEAFTEFGQYLLDLIPNDEDWKVAELHFRIQKGYFGVNANYTIADGNKISMHPGNYVILRKSLEWLHRESHIKWNSKWNKAVFWLKPDSQFEIDYIFDDQWQGEVDRLNMQSVDHVLRFNYQNY